MNMVKIFASFVNGKLTKMKEFLTDQALLEREGLTDVKVRALLREIDETEQRTLLLIRDNFEDLRDFVYHNIRID